MQDNDIFKMEPGQQGFLMPDYTRTVSRTVTIPIEQFEALIDAEARTTILLDLLFGFAELGPRQGELYFYKANQILKSLYPGHYSMTLEKLEGGAK